MISKRILIWTFVMIFLVQFITCSTTKETKSKDSAATKTGVKPKEPAKSKSKSATTATDPMELGMNTDEDTAQVPEKPTGLRHKLFKPIKSIFWPIRFLWGKFKNFKNKYLIKNKKQTAKPAETELSGEYVD